MPSSRRHQTPGVLAPVLPTCSRSPAPCPRWEWPWPLMAAAGPRLFRRDGDRVKGGGVGLNRRIRRGLIALVPRIQQVLRLALRDVYERRLDPRGGCRPRWRVTMRPASRTPPLALRQLDRHIVDAQLLAAEVDAQAADAARAAGDRGGAPDQGFAARGQFCLLERLGQEIISTDSERLNLSLPAKWSVCSAASARSALLTRWTAKPASDSPRAMASATSSLSSTRRIRMAQA